MGILLAHVVVAVKTDFRSRHLAIEIGLMRLEVRRTVVVDILHIPPVGHNLPRVRMVTLVVVGVDIRMAHPRQIQRLKLVQISHHQAFLLNMARKDLLNWLRTKVVLLFGSQAQVGWQIGRAHV